MLPRFTRTSVSLLVLAAIFCAAAPAQFNPFHVPGGATKVVPGWGPPPVDHTDPQNVAKYQARLDYLKANGFSGEAKIRLVTMDPIPGFPPPPTFPYVVFTWAEKNAEESVHDYGLFLKGPDVTLTELKNHFKFGDPKMWVPFVEPKPQEPSPKPTPSPSQPANPIGPEISEGSGTFFPVAGDTLAKGTVFLAPNGDRYEKFVRQTPFGAQAWWKRLP
jgi:hypothetical protein